MHPYTKISYFPLLVKNPGKMRKFVFLLLLSICLLPACRKCGNPYIKLLGNYKLTHFMVDGAEALPAFQDSLGTNFSFSLDADRDKYECYITGQRTDGKPVSLYWWWTGTAKADGILVLYSSSRDVKNGVGPFGKRSRYIWTFLMRNDAQLSMLTTYNHKEYRIDLER